MYTLRAEDRPSHVDVASDTWTCTAFKLSLTFTAQYEDKLGKEWNWRRQYTEYETRKIVICGVFLSVFMIVYPGQANISVNYNSVFEINI